MPIFPTQYSTLSSKALNEYLQLRYDLGDTQCRLLIRNVSDTYILENTVTKYIFKIYRDSHRKVGEIKGEVELLTLLYKQGAKVSHPLPDNQGDYLQRFECAEGIRYGVLFTWAEGRVIYDLNEQQLDIVGKEMAVVHNISSTVQLNHYRKQYTIESTITSPLKSIEPAFKDLANEFAYLQTTGNAVSKRLQKFVQQEFSYGYCHYDFLPKNFHITADNQVTFFDFDFAGEGLLANDIASFFIHYFLEVNYGKISVEAARSSLQTFVESYRKIRQLSDDELKAIPDLGFAFWLFYLGFQYENYDDWSNAFFSPKFIADRVSIIKKWMETSPLLLP
ncbi:MAG: phosphotransferase [Mucilaginibacter sp.]